VFWTGVRIPPGPPKAYYKIRGWAHIPMSISMFLMGLHSFDRAKSNRMDSTVGDDRGHDR